MKKLLYITGIIIFLGACAHRFGKNVETNSLVNTSDKNLLLNYDASLAANNKIKDPKKHSSCRHYHKKKYE